MKRRSLWFTQVLAADILAGRKRDTIRPLRPGLPEVGDEVRASVGPRPSFAILVVKARELLGWSDLDAERQAGMRSHYRKVKDLTDIQLVRLSFDVLEMYA